MSEGEPPPESDSTEVAPTAAGPTPLDEPQRIGLYRLLQKLGKGGMGEV